MTPTPRYAARRGQAFIALIFLIGSIIILVGITVAFLVSSLVDTTYGYEAANKAEFLSTAGAEDALLQIDRNPVFSSLGYSVSIPVSSSTATVTVSQDTPVVNQVTILSVATVLNRTRKVNVVVTKDPSTGQTSVASWQDTP